MKMSSPLRYPGGKSALSGLLRDIRRENGIGNTDIAEPFAGGAGASLTLLYLEEAPAIHINDADSAIFDFWWSVLNRTDQFDAKISRSRLNVAEWRRQRETYKTKKRISRVDRGFATFYLNRCNRSGVIMNGGPIGGLAQDGEWKIDARFNKSDLRQRCTKVAEYKDRISVSNEDGITFIKRLRTNNVFYFIDPPYFEKGKTLYLNSLDEDYHCHLANELKGMADTPWVLTYDDCPQIRRLYRGWANVKPFSLQYAASERRKGKEILITPKWLKLPKTQESAAIVW